MDVRRPRRARQAKRRVSVHPGHGFTLLELMIVVAIIAILAAIAVPTYNGYITRTRRGAATACLSQYANYMERYYTTYMNYKQDTAATPVLNQLPKLDCAAASQTGPYYQYGFGAGQPTATTYTIVATPIAGGVQAKRDTQCAALGIDQSGQRYYQTGKKDDAGVRACWRN